MLGSMEADVGEISLFLMLRKIETVQDYILTNVSTLQNNQFFSEATVQQLQYLHQTLWMEKYQLNELEYKLINRLIEQRFLSLSEVTKFLRENQLSTPLVAGWMHHFIRKLHQDGQFFIETRPHPSGSEYCWEPGRKEQYV